MALVINTNVQSLNAQRNLSASQSSMATALQRLSSGLRINSAKDDAAGLAISNRFTTQIRGLNQAVRNASDGISLAQTGESALGELTNNLQRIRELAVQAANSTNSASDRAALDLEVQQRLAEIERIATQTSFNGQKVLDGTFGEATFQVGANVGETIGLDLNTSMRRTAIGAVATATTEDLGTLITEESDAEVNASAASGAHTTSVAGANGETFSITVDGQTAFSFTAAAANDDVTAAEIDTGIASNLATLNGAGIEVSGTAAGGDLTFSRTDGAAFDIVVANTMATTPGGFAGADFATGSNAIDNGAEAQAAVPMTITELTIAIGDADAVDVAAGDYDTMQDFVDAVNTALSGNATATLDSETGVMSIVSGETIAIGGTDAGTVFSATSFAAGGSVDSVNVLNLTTANDAIQRIDSALTSVSNLRSTFGAIQNRFESTIANLQTVSENLEASRSRILDADFAAETASLTKAQILQQAGIAILAQANQAPQSVLALLQ